VLNGKREEVIVYDTKLRESRFVSLGRTKGSHHGATDVLPLETLGQRRKTAVFQN